MINALFRCQKSPQISCRGYLCLCVCEWHPHRIMPKYGCYLHPHNTHVYAHHTPTYAGLRGVATIMQFHLTHTLRLPHLNTYHSSVPALVVNDCWWWSLLYLTGKITSGSKSWANFSEESEMFSFTLYLLVYRFCTADCILRRILYPIDLYRAEVEPHFHKIILSLLYLHLTKVETLKTFIQII